MWIRITSASIGLALILLISIAYSSGLVSKVHARQPVMIAQTFATSGVPVMTIGSSTAAGWGDNSAGGYIARAFRDLSVHSKTSYQVLSRAIPGITVTQVATHYKLWLKLLHPHIVVISWGGLDDAYLHTPISVFRKQLVREIAIALDNKAVVIVVTPPVTETAYLDGKSGLPYQYFVQEVQAAQQFHSPYVFSFDVYDQMLQYMAQHHQSYLMYMDNSWHPNPAGHLLASKFLYSDIIHTFGKVAIA